MAGKVKLFMNIKETYLMKLLGSCQLVIMIVMVLLSFVGSLVFGTGYHSHSEPHVNRVFEAREDSRLVGHVIESSITDEFKCGLLCKRNIKCHSYNQHSDGQNSSGICQLNDQTRDRNPNDLIPSEGVTYFEKIIRFGRYSLQPGHSCKHIRDSGDARGAGEYWIDPEKNGNPLLVYCDMATDGGGWLLIYNIVIDALSPPTALGIESSYRGIINYNNNKMVLATAALNELRTHLSFNQLRFHCHKQAGSTFHVTTVANSTGEAVVQFFSRQTDAMPYACGSFVRMEGDNSGLAGDCAKWGKDNNGVFHAGRWGHQGMRELYQYPAFIRVHHHWITAPDSNRWECDDFANTASPGDFWKIYVR